MTDTTVPPAEVKSISILQPTSCISWVVLKRLMHSLYSGESNKAVPPALLKWITSIESIRLLFHRFFIAVVMMIRLLQYILASPQQTIIDRLLK
jgi:hypothetical protein